MKTTPQTPKLLCENALRLTVRSRIAFLVTQSWTPSALAWREEADSFPVDAAGTLSDGQHFEGALELVQILRQDDRFLRCVTEKLATYALGRPMTPQDRPMLQSVLNNLDPEHPTLRQILLGIIQSQTFRQQAVLRS